VPETNRCRHRSPSLPTRQAMEKSFDKYLAGTTLYPRQAQAMGEGQETEARPQTTGAIRRW